MSILLLLVILGILAFVFSRATFIDAEFKELIKWVLIVIGAVAIVIWILSLVGVGPGLSLSFLK